MTQEITNAVQRFFSAVDGRDWQAVEALMSSPFHLDYSSFGAGPAAELTPADILTGWRTVLPGFDATQHHLGPLDIQITGNTAKVKATVIATHFIAGVENGDTWTVHGDYVLRLIDDGEWKLSANTFNFRFLTGNTELPALAQSRAAT
ncbi:nuclear transport factor 2 family protein [Shimia abyssi]|uniref:SnoaL-like protein n=1 Tax=Shimia abyssi TaxID=1662395 RepID=A0A2P8FCF0_9RHOB|nr:nuclear transport factor 2 family protein [Shimia abyssi]PSL19384.1 SnoaL-like protein [Shimia abyssi]